MRFHIFITRIGFKRSQHDYCQYHCTGWKVLIPANLIAVIKGLKRKLSIEFKMKEIGEVRCFIVLNIKRNRGEGTMTIDQKQYVKKILHRFEMADCKPSATLMEP